MQNTYTSFTSAVTATVNNVKQFGGIVLCEGERVSQRLKEINVAVNDNALNAYYDTLEASASPTLFWNDYMELVEAVICELDIAVESYEQY